MHLLSAAVLTAMAQAFEDTIGQAPTLELRAGTPPAAIATADSGTLLASGALPTDWLSNGSAIKSNVGTWTLTGSATGKATYYRIKQGATAHVQGLISMPWAGNNDVVAGEYNHIGGNVYRCTTPGKTAATGGPSGTGASITDGTAVWAWVQAGTDSTIENTSIAVGQQVTVNSFTLTQIAA